MASECHHSGLEGKERGRASGCHLLTCWFMRLCVVVNIVAQIPCCSLQRHSSCFCEAAAFVVPAVVYVDCTLMWESMKQAFRRRAEWLFVLECWSQAGRCRLLAYWSTEQHRHRTQGHIWRPLRLQWCECSWRHTWSLDPFFILLLQIKCVL